jgi:hypothetical protein
MAIAIIPLTGGLIFRTVPRMLIKKSPASTGEVFGGRFSNSLPLGMIGCFLVFPLASWYLRQPSEIIAAGWAFLMLVLVRRLTAGVRRDLKTSIAKKRIFFNRLLYDRPTQRHPPDGASAR